MFYTLRRFGRVSTFWNPLDTHPSVADTMSVFNYKINLSQVKSLPDIIVPQAGLDTFWHNSEKPYFEIIIDALSEDGAAGAALTFGLRHVFLGFSHYDAAALGGRIWYSPDSQATPQPLWTSAGGGEVQETGGPPDVVVDHTGEHGFAQGDRLMFALNFATQKGWLGRNGTWMNSGNPAAGTNWQWSWSDIQTTQPEFRWRFFFYAGGNNWAVHPAQFRLATGSNTYPQIYPAPTGFTAFNPPASSAFYGGFNLWESTTNGGSTSFQPSVPDWPDLYWRLGGTLFLGQTCFGRSHGLLYEGGKYYAEPACSVSNTATSVGVMSSGQLSPAIGTISSAPIYALLEGAGTLAASAGITADSTGVSAYAVGNVINIAVDRAAGKMWFGKNGTWFNSGNPAAGTNPQFTGIPTSDVLAFVCGVVSASRGWGINATPALFAYTPPTGFVAPPVIEAYP